MAQLCKSDMRFNNTVGIVMSNLRIFMGSRISSGLSMTVDLTVTDKVILSLNPRILDTLDNDIEVKIMPKGTQVHKTKLSITSVSYV